MENTRTGTARGPAIPIGLLTLAMLFIALLPCRALDDPGIVAAGDWSAPVAGTADKTTGRGAHRHTIRGRLLLCESPKDHQLAVYVELQDCGDTWGRDTEVYCNMKPGGGCRLEFRDGSGQPLPPGASAFGGGMPGANWFSLPCDSTIRVRLSPYGGFSFASTQDYVMSGSFAVDPPADHTGLDVWQGTLKLPEMKVTVRK